MYADSLLINSIIGEGTKLRGEFELKGLLRIDGEFIGKIDDKGGRVLVGVNGKAVAGPTVDPATPFIIAEIIIIGGKVKGHVKAMKRLVLLDTAELIGDIETPRIVADEGAFYEGKCTVTKQPGTEDDKLSDQKVLSMAKRSLGSH
ncbi:MAG: polymer-forming cytoskeletal protein [Spirochaetes bacterium]|nr:polymer-forming cytoskeletal protein [Spirochaetota bacterium]